MSLLERAKSHSAAWIDFRRELHRKPELSFEESETASAVIARLDRLGVPYRAGVGGHGVVAELAGNGPGPTIALRADMDALPIQEDTGLPFASERPGVMHACGHDAHTAILLGTAELLVREKFGGTIRLLFQSAEEINAGARAMIAEGVLGGVDEIYGLHNLPTLSAGLAATRVGPMMGSVDRIEIMLEGRGAHGAIPDQGIDSIVCASAIVQSLQSIVSREVSPFAPVVVTIGSIHAGEANNVIPQSCEMTGTIRSFDPTVQKVLPEAVERIVNGIAEAHRCQAKVNYVRQVPVLSNHGANVAHVDAVIDVLIGSERRIEASPTLAGEDFSLYLEEVPGCFFWLGSGPAVGAEKAYGLHHPRFTLNEACIPLGASLLATIALSRLNAFQSEAEDAAGR
ncbi:M20 family metallopeptidase [Cohnella suwonensis]|uniref:M20 family metallopeptidase n=1 Tax=Cohnella suwonensis TaxID=696072 RepID=A0ABW0LR75_9BACL